MEKHGSAYPDGYDVALRTRFEEVRQAQLCFPAVATKAGEKSVHDLFDRALPIDLPDDKSTDLVQPNPFRRDRCLEAPEKSASALDLAGSL